MSSSRVIVSKQEPVYLAHICSCCDSPILSVVLIYAKAEKVYSFSQKKAQEAASDDAGLAIIRQIRRIEDCKRDHRPLTAALMKDSSYGRYCESSISGFDAPCPICGAYEPWKNMRLEKLPMSQLKEENFPRVIRQQNDAHAWVQKVMEERIEQIKQAQPTAETVLNAKKEAVILNEEILRLEEQRGRIPELAQMRLLQQENAALAGQAKKIGLLDLKRKRENKERLKICALRMRDVKALLAKKQVQLTEQIIPKMLRLQEVQVTAYGCTGGIRSKTCGNTVAYQVEPNPICPQDIITYRSANAVPEHAEGVRTLVADDAARPMFCRKCGARLLQDSTFCRRCGTEVAEVRG